MPSVVGTSAHDPVLCFGLSCLFIAVTFPDTHIHTHKHTHTHSLTHTHTQRYERLVCTVQCGVWRHWWRDASKQLFIRCWDYRRGNPPIRALFSIPSDDQLPTTPGDGDIAPEPFRNHKNCVYAVTLKQKMLRLYSYAINVITPETLKRITQMNTLMHWKYGSNCVSV